MTIPHSQSAPPAGPPATARTNHDRLRDLWFRPEERESFVMFDQLIDVVLNQTVFKVPPPPKKSKTPPTRTEEGTRKEHDEFVARFHSVKPSLELAGLGSWMKSVNFELNCIKPWENPSVDFILQSTVESSGKKRKAEDISLQELYKRQRIAMDTIKLQPQSSASGSAGPSTAVAPQHPTLNISEPRPVVPLPRRAMASMEPRTTAGTPAIQHLSPPAHVRAASRTGTPQTSTPGHPHGPHPPSNMPGLLSPLVLAAQPAGPSRAPRGRTSTPRVPQPPNPSSASVNPGPSAQRSTSRTGAPQTSPSGYPHGPHTPPNAFGLLSPLVLAAQPAGPSRAQRGRTSTPRVHQAPQLLPAAPIHSRRPTSRSNTPQVYGQPHPILVPSQRLAVPPISRTARSRSNTPVNHLPARGLTPSAQASSSRSGASGAMATPLQAPTPRYTPRPQGSFTPAQGSDGRAQILPQYNNLSTVMGVVRPTDGSPPRYVCPRFPTPQQHDTPHSQGAASPAYQHPPTPAAQGQTTSEQQHAAYARTNNHAGPSHPQAQSPDSRPELQHMPYAQASDGAGRPYDPVYEAYAQMISQQQLLPYAQAANSSSPLYEPASTPGAQIAQQQQPPPYMQTPDGSGSSYNQFPIPDPQADMLPSDLLTNYLNAGDQDFGLQQMWDPQRYVQDDYFGNELQQYMPEQGGENFGFGAPGEYMDENLFQSLFMPDGSGA